MPNLIPLTWPSLNIVNENQTGVFPIFGFLVKPLKNKNCHNYRTSNDIDMKLVPVTKLDRRNTTTLRMGMGGCYFNLPPIHHKANP